jgi:CRISPR-associated protein Csd2
MAKHDLNAVVDRRFDFALLFDVTDGNPNGDPDSGNLPRIDPQTMQGVVTDGCLKRKVRDYVTLKTLHDDTLGEGYGIYIQLQGVLERSHLQAYREAVGLDEKAARENKDSAKTDAARTWMCQHFYDVRSFGAVMSLKVNCGQVRGPVQLTFGRSIDPIAPQEITIVRKAVATEREAEKQTESSGAVTGTIGRKSNVPYGLYRTHGFINPHLASQTGFTYRDLSVFFQALVGMFEIDRSASRGMMTTRGIYVFEHESPLGNAPAHELLERVRVEPLGMGAAPRSFDDYRDRLSVSVDDLPAGVSFYELPRQHEELLGGERA